jgi:hypothetical protein
MTIEQTFTLATITLTALNVGLTFFNLKYSRKKDFQDKLYQLKLDAYKELNESCYEATQRLDINSTPFVQIYDFKDKNEWTEYCKQNMGEQHHLSFNLQKLTYKNSLILPSDIVDKYHEFTNFCIAFVTSTYHFDTGTIINNQDRLWELYTDLLNSFRKDLKIETIDGGLRQRIS